MSRTTKEINRITTTIISMSVRLLFLAFCFFLMYEGAARGYRLGHEIFSPASMEAAPGTDREIVIEEGESTSELAARLEEDGLIENRLIFVIQSKFYDYEIYPGTYLLNTSMTSKDMLKRIDAKDTVEETAGGETGESGDSRK